MSITIEKIKGFTVTLKENLNANDFDFFDALEEKYEEFAFDGEYGQGYMKPNQVALVVDGMDGDYARLVYIESVKEIYNADETDKYMSLKEKPITEEIYKKLNEVYQKIYEKPLDVMLIDYALWFHWS